MHESPRTLARLQRILERSAATAGPAMRQNFAAPAWTMSAEELVRFWGPSRMASISTVSGGGKVHVAPLDVTLEEGTFHARTFANARRLQDLLANPRCAISTWEGEGFWAVIVYGNAHVSDRQSGGTVDVQVKPTRIYAIRPPEGHHARGTEFSTSILGDPPV